MILAPGSSVLASCSEGEIACNRFGLLICISETYVCDGKGNCPGSTDENYCPGLCGDFHDIDLGLNQTVSIIQPIDESVDCLWLATASGNQSRIRVDILKLSIVEYVNDFTTRATLSFGVGHDASDLRTVVKTLNTTTYPGVITFQGPTIWIVLDVLTAFIGTEEQFHVEFSISEYTVKDCGFDQYACSSGILCINKSQVCDGEVDCPEFDDEFDCGHCGTNSYSCRSGVGCVDAFMLCNGQYDCPDGSDEGKCEPCGDGIVDLSDGPHLLATIGYPNSYPHNTYCVWHVYAGHGYDVMIVFLDFETENSYDLLFIGNGAELETPSFEMSGSRHPARLSLYSESIWLVFRSDYIISSYRGFNLSLEKVGHASCGEGEVACNGNNLLICISETYVCDGKSDCPGSTEENYCPGPCGDFQDIDLSLNQTVSIIQPIEVSVDCLWLATVSRNHSRIRVDILKLPIVEYVNDFITRAKLSFGVGHDAHDLRTVVKTLNTTTYPGVITFPGPTIWIVLDVLPRYIGTGGELHLEFNISEYVVTDCGINQYACSLGILCIDESQVCDGEVDCPEFDDEFGCGPCNANSYSCRSGVGCVEAFMLCDGQYDCPDSTDDDKCEPCGAGIIYLSDGPHPLATIGYPNSYPHNTYCVWHVYAGHGYDVMIVFLDFKTEESYDWLFIGNGVELVTPSFEISGSRHPARLSLYSESIWLVFRSDYMFSYRGFSLSLEKVGEASCGEGEVACNGTNLLICISEMNVCDGEGDCPGSTDEDNCSGVCHPNLIELKEKRPHHLTSPLYQFGKYPDDANCVWRFKDGTRTRIQLDIVSFHLEQRYDYLYIGTGNDTDNDPVARLTGTTKITRILFHSNDIWLQLLTDDLVSRTGFNITLLAIDNSENPPCSGCLNTSQTDADVCLHHEAFCDGVEDCVDGTDESSCVNVSCGKDYYRCKGKPKCLPRESLCDGHVDCQQFRDDEQECDILGRPDGCHSFIVDGMLQVKCKRGWNSTTVTQLVQITHSLELSGGNMAILEEGLFKRLPLLRTLSLRDNNISIITTNAFAGLKNLTSLDISETNIEELHSGVFSELSTLIELAMRSVPIQFIRANAFDGLTQLKKMVLMRGDGTANTVSSSQDHRATEVEDHALSGLRSLETVYVDDHRLCCDFRSVLQSDDQCVNIQLQSPLFNCGRLMPSIVLQVFMWILGFSALIGNAVVIAWRFREDSGKGSKYVHSFLVLNLAMSDFLMGVYMVIIASIDAIKKEEYYLTATEWRNSALCKAAGVISVLSSEASVFFITLISVDRYLCIVHPFSRVRLREKSSWASAAAIWAASLSASLVPTVMVTSDSGVYGLSDVCIGLPLLTRPVDYTFIEADVGDALGNDTYLIPKPIGSKPSWSYSIVLFLGVNFVCFLAITICYAGIFIKVKRSIRRVRRHSHKDEEIKMASKMAVIVGSDCLCWMPVIVLGILSQTSVIQIDPDVYAWLVVFVLPINSSLNPYLYTIVTVFSRRRQAHLLSMKTSQKPQVYHIPDVPLEVRRDSGCWTATTPTATPTSSVYCGY